MSLPLIKIAAVSCVVGGVALAGPALAVPALQLEAVPFAIPVVDEQDAVEEALEPDVMLPGSQEGNSAPGRPARAGGGGGSGSDEIDALQEAFPSTNWPQSDRKQ
jgi:hypothetical protein